MTRYQFARRSFLRGCGGSAALMLPLLRSIEARAAGLAAPLRLLILQHPLGTYPGLARWRPNASATTTNFTLPLESAPFAPLQKYMVMIDGLNLVAVAGGAVANSGQNTPEGGLVAMMTGVPTLGYVGQQDHCAGGPSIDQLLLQRSPALGGRNFSNPTLFGSLQLAADIRSDRDEVSARVLSYLAPLAVVDPAAARQPIYPETSPLNVYNRVFGSALPAGSGAGVLAQNLSAVDYMRRDLTRLKSLIPAAEKDKLDAYASAITQLEASLRAKYGASAGPTCTTPTKPPDFPATSSGAQPPLSAASSTLSGVDYYVEGQPNNHPHADLGMTQLRLIKAAFSCDLVRVATFMWAPGTSHVVFPGTFQGSTVSGGLTSAPHYAVSHHDDQATKDWLSQIDQFYSTATSTVLQEFATTPDIDGNMLIDNTIVVYLTEVARAFDGNQQNMPLILFGGKNTRLNGGTFLKVQDGALNTQVGGTGNRPFNDLWLALAPVLGVPLTSLGAPSQYTGPLPGVFSP